MKKRLVYQHIFVTLMALGVILAGTCQVFAQLDNFQLAAANEYLNLYINPETAEAAVEDRASGKMWFTNPQDRAATSRGTVLQRLSSQFTIVYHNENIIEVAKDNYRYCITYEQFEITPIEQGVRFDYTIVEEWKPEHYLPQMISQERMDELILGKIASAKDQQTVLGVYNLIMLAPVGDGERLAIRGLDQDKVFGEYDVVVLNPDYLEQQETLAALQAEQAAAADEEEKAKLQSQIDKLQQQMNKTKEDLTLRLLRVIQGSRADLDKIDDITPEDMSQLVNTPTYLMAQVPAFRLTGVQAVVVETGYTPIDAGLDHEMNNLDPPLPNLEIFQVPIEYVLDGPNLLVRIPAKDIVYPIDVEDTLGEKYTFPLLRISVLEWFGAAGAEQDGYILVPDGSGALIYLNNGRINASAFNVPVYGRDNSLDLLKEVQNYPEIIRLPVFGLKQEDQAFFAIIEEGAPLARIRADISGRAANYNQVYAEFVPLPSGEISYRIEDVSSGRIPTYQARKYEGDFVIRFAFLTGEKADYAGMAECYRNYLTERYDLTPVESRPSIPFYLELIGAIDKLEPVLGIARTVTHPLTTFSQAQEIAADLGEQGIEQIQLKYTGWLRGGVNHHYPDQAAAEKVLGGEADFRDLIAFMEEQGYELYPSVGFMRVYRTSFFSKFSPRKHAARFLDQLPARAHRFYLDSFERNSSAFEYLLSPGRLPWLVDSFMQDYQKYGLNSISLFDMAREVNSDFVDKAEVVIDRVQAEQLVSEQLEKIKASGSKLMVDRGNAYALPYADAIVNLPTSSSGYSLVNASIPFYQMVIHGLIDYAGEPINLASNQTKAVLRMLESGGYPYFIGSYAESFEVKNTDFEHLYALHYRDWLDHAAEIYRVANEVLKDVQDQRIVDHRILADGVHQTTYANGKSIIVNYNREAVTVDGRWIGAENFIVLEGGVYEH